MIQRRRPCADHAVGRAARSTDTPIATANRTGSARNRPMASQVGFNTVKSTPSEWRSSEPTTAAAAAPIVHRRNQDGPISH